MKRLLRAPLLHFLVLGALLHGLWALVPDPPAVRVEAGAEDVARLRRDWRAETGRWPQAGELRASVERFLDEQALLAEALDEGLDARDPVARERLLQNLRFVLPDYAGDDAAALADAQALGMPASDLVVRRRLVQLMEHRLAEELPPDEVALRAYVAAHPERYGAPARLRLRQVFFSADRPGAEARATAAMARLAVEPGLDADALGDPSLLTEPSAPQDEAQLARRYGAAFAAALREPPVGRWLGPLRSAYGWHLVRIDERLPAQAPDFAAVRERAAWAWRAERQQQRLPAQIAPLRARHGLPDADTLLRQAGA